MPGQPVVDEGGLVGGQVVADDMDVQLGGYGLVDGDEEFAVFYGPVLAVQFADDGAVGDVERGEQAGGAVPGVVVGAPFGHARHHRQHRLGSVQGLHLRFLVHAHDNRPLGRVVV